MLLGFLRARHLHLPRGWLWWRHFLVIALVGSAIPFTLLAWGEQHISSALTAVLNASTPLFTALFAGLLLGDRLRAAQIAGLALGFVGVAGSGPRPLTAPSELIRPASRCTPRPWC